MTLEIGGPSYSWREIVAAADRARGRELPVHFVPPGGELPLLDPAVCGWLSSFETYEDFIDMDDLPTRFGLEITPLPTVMKQMFGPRKSLYLVNGLPTNPGHYPFQMKPLDRSTCAIL